LSQYKSNSSNLKNQTSIRSPFGYFGSKFRLASTIINHIPPHNAWVEAFCGSISLTLAKPPAPIEVINDINGEIVNFFKQLRDNPRELCRQISLTPYARKEFIQSRNASPASELERARVFLVNTMMSMNGASGIDKGGFSISQSYSRDGKEARVSRWYHLPERLELIVERLRSIRIESRDAIDLLNSFANRPATLVYLDPPYLGKRMRGYDFDANCEKFHTRLLSAAKNASCMILLSGYSNALYSDMLTKKDGWTNVTIETQTRGHNGIDKGRVEMLWSNASCTNALAKKRIPVRLSKFEKVQKKVNPTRK
jgi:DNA adenine methylase